MQKHIENFGDLTMKSSKPTKEKNMILPILAEMNGSIHVGLVSYGLRIGGRPHRLGRDAAVGRNPGAATPILVQAILAIA